MPGLLMRIVADKFLPGVKAAVLRTLMAVLGKAGVTLKPFQLQLQATNAKALADPTLMPLREHAARALGFALAHHAAPAHAALLWLLLGADAGASAMAGAGAARPVAAAAAVLASGPGRTHACRMRGVPRRLHHR